MWCFRDRLRSSSECRLFLIPTDPQNLRFISLRIRSACFSKFARVCWWPFWFTLELSFQPFWKLSFSREYFFWKVIFPFWSRFHAWNTINMNRFDTKMGIPDNFCLSTINWLNCDPCTTLWFVDFVNHLFPQVSLLIKNKYLLQAI